MLNEIKEMLAWLGECVEWSIIPQNDKFAMVHVYTYYGSNGLPTVSSNGRVFCSKELLEHEAIEYDYSEDCREWYYFSDCTVCWDYQWA